MPDGDGSGGPARPARWLANLLACAWLAMVMAVSTVIGLYYYLKWGAMLFRARTRQAAPLLHSPARSNWPSVAAVFVCLAVTVLLSILPSLALGLMDRL